MFAESKVVLSAENETETESGSYPDPKQYTAEKKLVGTQIKGTCRAKEQQQLYVDTAAAALPPRLKRVTGI